jgi:tRNA (guanosine-2'-O-)-methyltransferase
MLASIVFCSSGLNPSLPSAGVSTAIVRTADAVGVHEVHAVWPDHRMRPMVSAAAGSNSWVQVKNHTTIGEAVSHLKGRGMQVLATHLSDNAVVPE